MNELEAILNGDGLTIEVEGYDSFEDFMAEIDDSGELTVESAIPENTIELVGIEETLAGIADRQLMFQDEIVPMFGIFLGVLVGAIIGSTFISQWKVGI